MKTKISLLALASVLAFSACTTDQNVDPQNMEALAPQDVPVLVTQAVNTVYPKAMTIDYSSLQTNAIYVANVTTAAMEAQVVVSNKGIIKEEAIKIAKTDLPAAVLTYLDTNFPAATIEHASKKTKGDKLGYRVELVFNKEHYSVFFDATGAFLHQITGMQGKPGKKGPAPAATEIALADLPAAVKSAISVYTFKRAILVKDPKGVEIYHIRVEKVGVPYDLAIDASGKILKSKEVNTKAPNFTKIELKTLPAGLTAFLNANAAGFTLDYAVAISKDSVIVEYHVGVTIGTTKKEFHLDAKFQPVANSHSKSGHNPPSLTIKELKLTDLTAAITSYLTTNYVGWVLVKGTIAFRDSTIMHFHVVIEVSSKKYLLEFEGNGAFKKAIAL
ncbi:PepSY-like domain-containing protein [Aquirufa sp. A-Brett2-15D]